MAYDPEKTNANTSGEKPPPKQPNPNTIKGLGKTALGGKK